MFTYLVKVVLLVLVVIGEATLFNNCFKEVDEIRSAVGDYSMGTLCAQLPRFSERNVRNCAELMEWSKHEMTTKFMLTSALVRSLQYHIDLLGVVVVFFATNRVIAVAVVLGVSMTTTMLIKTWANPKILMQPIMYEQPMHQNGLSKLYQCLKGLTQISKVPKIELVE